MHVCLYWAMLTLRESSGQGHVSGETSGKGTTLCASALRHLERKGLFEAVTQGAAFLGSPYFECVKVKYSALACQYLTRRKGLLKSMSHSPRWLGTRDWCLQPTTIHWVCLVWDSEAICATS